jgi:hypothetical protein
MGKIWRLAGLSLLAAAAWITLLSFGNRDQVISPAIVDQRSDREVVPDIRVPQTLPAVPRPESKEMPPERKEIPRNKKPTVLTEPRKPNSEVLTIPAQTTTIPEAPPLPAIVNDVAQDDDFTPAESPKRQIEDLMDRAIRIFPALEDVLVAFNKR